MQYKETIDTAIWSEPDERQRVTKIGMKAYGDVFNELKSKLEDAGLLPDEYFELSPYADERHSIPEFDEAVCQVNFGGSEGIYLDIFLKCQNAAGQHNLITFATGKTLGEDTSDFYKMSLIAGECSMLLNGNGCKVRDDTKTILILDETEVHELRNALYLQKEFNDGMNRSNETVYGLIDAVGENNYALEDEADNEMEE